MKSWLRRMGLGMSFFLVFVLGCGLGLMGSSYLYYRHVFTKAVDRFAADLSWQLDALSRLRAGDIEGVINRLEMMVDSNMISVAGTPHIPRNDFHRRILKSAKTYRDIYPSTSRSASQVNDALNSVFSEEESPPLLGKPAPDFEAKLLDGGLLRCSDHKEKDIVILVFWASWCGNCLNVMPVIENLAADYAEKGVMLYAVNQGEDESTIRRFLKEAGHQVAVALDPETNIGDIYQVQALPQTVIVGKDGTVQAVHFGFLPAMEKAWRRELDMLLEGRLLAGEQTQRQ